MSTTGKQSHGTGSEYCESDDGGGKKEIFLKRSRNAKGEILELKNTINTMVDQLIHLLQK